MEKLVILPKAKLTRRLFLNLIVIVGLIAAILPTPQGVWAPSLPETEKLLMDTQDRLYVLEMETELQNRIIKYYRDVNTKTLRATAYTARVEECDPTPEVTAIMEPPVPGWTVAVSHDLKHWLGKTVYIYGLGVRRVNDLMNVRYENAIDILVGTVPEARRFGVRELEVVVIYQQAIKGKEGSKK